MIILSSIGTRGLDKQCSEDLDTGHAGQRHFAHQVSDCELQLTELDGVHFVSSFYMLGIFTLLMDISSLVTFLALYLSESE